MHPAEGALKSIECVRKLRGRLSIGMLGRAFALDRRCAVRDLLEIWRDDIVGDWEAVLAGSDLLLLAPVVTRFSLKLKLGQDGTAQYKFTIPNQPDLPPEPTSPFPFTWNLSIDRILCIWIPISPMPEYHMPDWTREELCYDVLSVTSMSLAISNRRFDNEDVIILRRVNTEEYDRRKVAEYAAIAEYYQRALKE
jgi:hypothetical protein